MSQVKNEFFMFNRKIPPGTDVIQSRFYLSENRLLHTNLKQNV